MNNEAMTEQSVNIVTSQVMQSGAHSMSRDKILREQRGPSGDAAQRRMSPAGARAEPQQQHVELSHMHWDAE
jgi:hypothetical protein